MPGNQNEISVFLSRFDIMGLSHVAEVVMRSKSSWVVKGRSAKIMKFKIFIKPRASTCEAAAFHNISNIVVGNSASPGNTCSSTDRIVMVSEQDSHAPSICRNSGSASDDLRKVSSLGTIAGCFIVKSVTVDEKGESSCSLPTSPK